MQYLLSQTDIVGSVTGVLLLVTQYITTSGGCRDASGNKTCCANYYQQNGSCLECPVGYFGINCTEKCPNNYYGQFCVIRCECPERECDHRTGCSASVTTPSFGDKTSVTSPSSACINNNSRGNCSPCLYPWYGFYCREVCQCERTYCDPIKGCLNDLARKTTADPSDTEDTTFQPKNGVVLGSAGVISLIIIILIVYILLKMRVDRQKKEEQENVSTDDDRYGEINEVNLNNVPNEEIEIENPRRKYEFVHKYQNVDNFIYSKMETDNTKYHEIVDLIETDESMISENRYSHDSLVNENNVYEEPMVSANKHTYINVIELKRRNCSEDIEQALNREATISEKPHYENRFFIEDHEPSLHNTDIDSNNRTQQDISSSCPPKGSTYLDVVF